MLCLCLAESGIDRESGDCDGACRRGYTNEEQ